MNVKQQDLSPIGREAHQLIESLRRAADVIERAILEPNQKHDARQKDVVLAVMVGLTMLTAESEQGAIRRNLSRLVEDVK